MAMDTQEMEAPGGTPPIAVVILNWNGEKLLKEFLPKVVATTDASISRIIVADNGSTDGSLAYVADAFPENVEVMSFPENYGFAEGYNKAVARCSGYKYVVLLNSDVATSPGWDRELYLYMEANPDTAACQPKILSYREPDRFEYAGACGGFLDGDGYPYCRGRIFGECEQDYGQYDTPAEVFWASGACLMVRPSVYMEAGALDSAFFAHMEEIDLCWRILLLGKKIAVVPSAKVYHLGGGSLPAENPRKTYLNFRNNLLMLHKNLPDSCRRSALIRRRLLDTLAWAKYVLSFDWANAAAIFRAHRHFAHMRKEYTQHPAVNLLSQRRWPCRSILFEYYIRRIRRFGELVKTNLV